jgi:ABC-2 type transport system ATP-binding protein
MLEVSGLYKNYGKFCAVKNLDFSVNKGEVFGFLGPNGAGKTTTMKIITGYLPMSKGLVKVAGRDICENGLESRKKIGYLPETTPLYTDMFVDEYLEFVGKLRGLCGENLKKRIKKMLEVCGLEEMQKKPIGHLSKGYRQRTGLAQAMIHEPELLILDEPMSGLDPNQIVEIRELVKEIGKEKAVVYCSHILSEVAATCNRILIINDGETAARGTPEEVITKAQGHISYEVVIKTKDKNIEEKFKHISQIQEIKAIVSSDTLNVKLKIETNSEKEIGEEIFDVAVKNNWKITLLSHKKITLEDVFSKLTRKDAK